MPDSSRPPRIDVAHVIGALALGGAERFVVDLASRLAARGWQPAVLTLGGRGDRVETALHESLTGCGVQVRIGPPGRLGLRTVAWYGATVAAMRPRLIHLHTANTGVAHLLGLPWHRFEPVTLRTVHTTKPPTALLERVAYALLPVARSIACSESVLLSHRRLVRGPFTVIRNGIAFSWPPRSLEGIRDARHRLGLDPARKHLLMIGSMKGDSLETAAKAHDLLLEAWGMAGDATEHADLHLLGDGPLRPEIERRTRSLRGVTLHGNRTDVPLWLSAADCFVMPSRWEGLPIAALEALGTGIPCLFADIPPLRELEGPGVAYFAAGSARSLTEELIAFLARPAAAPSTEAVAGIRSRFGIDRVATAYEDLYRLVEPA
jgi:glycosyltransferase involved in cell wall biosynthesis